jgi:rubrerythrin
MDYRATREPRAVLDQAIRAKALAADFFEFLSKSVPGVKLRQAFQQFGRDEREQRKILMKYRKDLYGGGEPALFRADPTALDRLKDGEISAETDLIRALGVAIESEEWASRFYTEAALNFSDRHAKVFFKILAESGRARCLQLNGLRVAVEKEGLRYGMVEQLELASEPSGS